MELCNGKKKEGRSKVVASLFLKAHYLSLGALSLCLAKHKVALLGTGKVLCFLGF